MRNDIFLVSLGICGYSQITREAVQYLELCRRVFFVHPEPLVEEYLRSLCPSVIDLYGAYAEGKPRSETYHEMASAVVSAAQQNPPVAFSTYGHVAVYCKPTEIIRTEARRLGLGVKV